jgi:hypothetical protein
MSGDPPNQGVKGHAQEQQAKPAAPAALAQLPGSAGKRQGSACPETHQAKYDCNTVSAIANVRQADAAERFNHLAYAEITVGIITAVVAALAANWAKKAATAGRRANKISKDTAKRQLRAYVGVDDFKVQIASLPNGYEPIDMAKLGVVFPDNLTVVIKNFGATPATGVVAFMGPQAAPFGVHFPPDFDYEAACTPRVANNIVSRHFLLPGKSEPIKFPLPDVRPFWAAERREMNIFLVGRIYYLDAFGEPHSTMFNFAWEPWHPHGARFVPLDKFNGEDDKREPQAAK